MSEFSKENALVHYQKLGCITSAAKASCEEYKISYKDKYRKKLSRYILALKGNTFSNITETTTSQYRATTDESLAIDVADKTQFSAIGGAGIIMSINEYCDHYKLPYDKVKSYKLVSHTAIPYYNIAFYESVIVPSVSTEEMMAMVQKGLTDFQYTYAPPPQGTGVGVVKIADLHIGAVIENLLRTKDFSVDILTKMLSDAAGYINKRNYKEVHVHILGDIIESFTGLNHKNVWKSMDPKIIGAQAVITATELLDQHFLRNIYGLKEVKIVAGNHDRVTSDKKEDMEGDVAKLVAWGLGLKGYLVEFNPFVITHPLGKITHILTHGHHPISKKSTKQMCWDYGIQGTFNLICEGHLHSIIENLSIKQRNTLKTTTDDAVDHRKIVCPSFFSGNFFGEGLGYTVNPGFLITEDNGKGSPHVFYYSL